MPCSAGVDVHGGEGDGVGVADGLRSWAGSTGFGVAVQHVEIFAVECVSLKGGGERVHDGRLVELDPWCGAGTVVDVGEVVDGVFGTVVVIAQDEVVVGDVDIAAIGVGSGLEVVLVCGGGGEIDGGTGTPHKAEEFIAISCNTG